MSGVTMPFTAPQGEMWQLSAGITLFAMALMDCLLQLDSPSPGNHLFLQPTPAMSVVARTFAFTGGKRAVTSSRFRRFVASHCCQPSAFRA
jgi:hypothetical protein